MTQIIKKSIYLSLFLFIFSACSPTSTKDYQTLSITNIKSLIYELKKIHDPTQLRAKIPTLKKKFNRLTQIMINYRNYLEKNPELKDDPSEELKKSAVMLMDELNRLYALDGGFEMIQEAQKEAYVKLSLFDQSLNKERIDMFQAVKPINF